MKYPRLKPEEDGRRKLMPDDIKQIKELYNQGTSLRKLAEMFNVNYTTIRYHVNEKYKRDTINRLDATSKALRNAGDVEFLEKQKKAQRKFYKKRRDVLIDFNVENIREKKKKDSEFKERINTKNRENHNQYYEKNKTPISIRRKLIRTIKDITTAPFKPIYQLIRDNINKIFKHNENK